MAYYAFLDENNIVVSVIPGKDENESTIDWEKFYHQETGLVCKRTSYNTKSNKHILGKTPFRGNFASIGYEYNIALDIFTPPKPFESWVLNEETANWESPVGSAPKLTQDEIDSGSFYRWDENSYKENNANGWILETFTVN